MQRKGELAAKVATLILKALRNGKAIAGLSKPIAKKQPPPSGGVVPAPRPLRRVADAIVVHTPTLPARDVTPVSYRY